MIPWLKARDIAILGWEKPDYALIRRRSPAEIAPHLVLTILGAYAGPGRLDALAMRRPRATGGRSVTIAAPDPTGRSPVSHALF